MPQAHSRRTFVQTCTSEFLSFVASEARARVQKEGRTTVSDADMLWALDKLGMKAFIDPLSSPAEQPQGSFRKMTLVNKGARARLEPPRATSPA